MNIVLLEPKNRENLATVLRSGQNFGVNAVFVIGGFVRETYRGNIHKFSHQMNTQNALGNVTLMYFEGLAEFLKSLPAQTTLVVLETLDRAQDLVLFEHPSNATYLFGREAKGLSKAELEILESHFASLNAPIPPEHRGNHAKTARLNYVKITTPASLNLGVCASIVMYDRHAKFSTKRHAQRSAP
jgi:tRNA(Leu) C34 or U34 (ribose-2'-O)-methylase TrmL